MTKSTKTSLAEFLEINHRRLVNFVRTKFDDVTHMDSEDIVQDVILGILNRPDVTEPVTNLTAYFFRALRNRIIDEYRKPYQNIQSLDEDNSDKINLYDILPDFKYEPENSYKRQQLREIIYTAIQNLPEKEKLVIIETEFNEVSFAELSKQMKTPVGTLLARKHRGLKTLKNQLKQLKEEHDVLFNS